MNIKKILTGIISSIIFVGAGLYEINFDYTLVNNYKENCAQIGDQYLSAIPNSADSPEKITEKINKLSETNKNAEDLYNVNLKDRDPFGDESDEKSLRVGLWIKRNETKAAKDKLQKAFTTGINAATKLKALPSQSPDIFTLPELTELSANSESLKKLSKIYKTQF